MTFCDQFPDYTITPDGRVFKGERELKPFHSNKYLQVLLFDSQHKRHIFGVHTLVAWVYIPEFYTGCIVHHKDKDCHNNSVENLEVLSQSEHARRHGKEYCALADYNKKYGPPNKGKKMSDAFCRKCSESAKKRGFNGNQYVNADRSVNYRGIAQRQCSGL